MWIVMMVAMMLPSLAPMLWRYRQAIAGTAASTKATASSAEAPRRRGETRPGRLAALFGAGYFFVWIVFGLAAFALGVVLTSLEMQQPALARGVPAAVAAVVTIAGALQFTRWKARGLDCYREALASSGSNVGSDHGEAWRYGVCLGIDCAHCCANLMGILLVIGIMDLRAMAAVTAAITIERLVPASGRAAQAVGAVAVAAGVFLMARAAGLA
jgi:predicted metal-binding membrane protein